MKKVFFLFIFCTTAFTARLHAQQLSKTYLDSVKAFYADWVTDQKDFVYTIIDNTRYPTDIEFCLYRISFESLFLPPCTVYKPDEKKTGGRIINDIPERQMNSKDSITFTEEETNYAFETIKASTTFKWTKEIFPNAEFIDSATYYTRLAATTGNPKPGYWALSLPAFFRDGAWCMMFYRYYCGPACGYEALIVYRNENGRWRRFGTLHEAVY